MKNLILCYVLTACAVCSGQTLRADLNQDGRVDFLDFAIMAEEWNKMPVDLTSYCVAQYKMNDNASSTTVVDAEGYSNGTAQQNTSVLASTGKINGALSFDGATDYIDTGSSFATVWASPYSISFWYKASGSGTGVEAILGAQNAALGKYIAVLLTESTLNFTYNDGTDGFDVIETAVDLSNASWHHVAVVAESGTTKLYVDNSLTIGNFASLFSGADSNCLLGAFIGYFVGSLDNVMIFNKALSSDEVSFLYNNGEGSESLFDYDNAFALDTNMASYKKFVNKTSGAIQYRFKSRTNFQLRDVKLIEPEILEDR